MIDEKKLIDDLMHNDGMKFEVKVADVTPEALGNAFQEFINKMKEGFIDLINAQPSFGWISVKERLPEKDGIYLTYNQKKEYGFHFFQMGKRMWPAIWDEDEVTHWMPLPEPPKGGEP